MERITVRRDDASSSSEATCEWTARTTGTDLTTPPRVFLAKSTGSVQRWFRLGVYDEGMAPEWRITECPTFDRKDSTARCSKTLQKQNPLSQTDMPCIPKKSHRRTSKMPPNRRGVSQRNIDWTVNCIDRCGGEGGHPGLSEIRARGPCEALA